METRIEVIERDSPDLTTAPAELISKNSPINYSEIARDSRVLLLADVHDNNAIRRHIVSHAEDLKRAGITHYLIEAKEQSNSVLERLNHGENVSFEGVDLGPGCNEEAVRAIAAEGIKIVAVDIDQSSHPSSEEREERMTENLMRFLEDNPDSKAAFLVGEFHTSKNQVLKEDLDMLGKRILDAGIPSVTVSFEGGASNSVFSAGTKSAGLASREFMIDLPPGVFRNTPYETSDYLIHLPQETLFPQNRGGVIGRFMRAPEWSR